MKEFTPAGFRLEFEFFPEQKHLVFRLYERVAYKTEPAGWFRGGFVPAHPWRYNDIVIQLKAWLLYFQDGDLLSAVDDEVTAAFTLARPVLQQDPQEMQGLTPSGEKPN